MVAETGRMELHYNNKKGEKQFSPFLIYNYSSIMLCQR